MVSGFNSANAAVHAQLLERSRYALLNRFHGDIQFHCYFFARHTFKESHYDDLVQFERETTDRLAHEFTSLGGQYRRRCWIRTAHRMDSLPEPPRRHHVTTSPHRDRSRGHSSSPMAHGYVPRDYPRCRKHPSSEHIVSRAAG